MRTVAVGVAITVLAATPALADGPGYRFFESRGGKPTAYWNPCETIDYGIDFTYAQRKGMRKTRELLRWRSVVAEVSTAMGVRFRYAGQVDTRSAGVVPRTKAPVDLVITFGNAKRGRFGYRKVLRGGVTGFGGVNWRSTGARSQVVSGYVVIDADDVVRRTDVWTRAFDPRPASQRQPDVLRALYMHEFGHAVGLDHVKDKRQLMYPLLQPDRADVLGAGDRRGLGKLGKQRCF
jgi:Matrixin